LKSISWGFQVQSGCDYHVYGHIDRDRVQVYKSHILHVVESRRSWS
jgi:hypothetical protein